MSEERLSADKIRGARSSMRAETRARALANAANRQAGRRVQINVQVTQSARVRLKVLADLTGETILSLVEGMILDGIADLENEVEKVRNSQAARG